MSVGSLVFICDTDIPRSQWKRGRVLELYKGKDGVARSAQVSKSAGVYRRPISKLAVLDVKVDVIDGEASPPESVHGGGDVVEGNPEVGNTSVIC